MNIIIINATVIKLLCMVANGGSSLTLRIAAQNQVETITKGPTNTSFLNLSLRSLGHAKSVFGVLGRQN